MWSRVARLLVEAGHEAIPVDLPGDDDTSSLSHFAQLVTETIDSAPEVVLVAGSLESYAAPLRTSRRCPLAENGAGERHDSVTWSDPQAK